MFAVQVSFGVGVMREIDDREVVPPVPPVVPVFAPVEPVPLPVLPVLFVPALVPPVCAPV